MICQQSHFNCFLKINSIIKLVTLVTLLTSFVKLHADIGDQKVFLFDARVFESFPELTDHIREKEGFEQNTWFEIEQEATSWVNIIAFEPSTRDPKY